MKQARQVLSKRPISRAVLFRSMTEALALVMPVMPGPRDGQVM